MSQINKNKWDNALEILIQKFYKQYTDLSCDINIKQNNANKQDLRADINFFKSGGILIAGIWYDLIDYKLEINTVPIYQSGQKYFKYKSYITHEMLELMLDIMFASFLVNHEFKTISTYVQAQGFYHTHNPDNFYCYFCHYLNVGLELQSDKRTSAASRDVFEQKFYEYVEKKYLRL